MNIITYSQVRELATQRRLSLNQLAREAGIARSVLDRWRSGKTTPNLRTIEKIQKALTKGEENDDFSVS